MMLGLSWTAWLLILAAPALGLALALRFFHAHHDDPQHDHAQHNGAAHDVAQQDAAERAGPR
ncbi:MAG TPA: hypothetical protein VMN60_00640 [Longimicrobiales bacterium]|nr:hypothetical protein [Longimicrobiales bacterium]